MNKVILIGRAVDDPSETTNGKGKDAVVITRTRIAVQRRFAKEDDDVQADFINTVAFGKLAETIGEYVGKGDEVKILGRLQTGSYENKDGVKVYTTDVIIEEFEFGRKKADSDSNNRRKR